MGKSLVALVRQSLRRLLRLANLSLIRHDELERLLRSEGQISEADCRFIATFSSSPYFSELLGEFPNSHAQIRQDLFVLLQSGFKTGGYFVEFGATNGVRLSNTYLLEKKFGWKGILAEPGKVWHGELRANRRCHLDTRCVWSSSGGTVEFNETYERELSTISSYSDSDYHAVARESGRLYSVKTVSLTDLLETYGAPNEIDYLSVDTEGSEYEILENFDFDRYSFRVASVEHNFTPARQEIFELLSNHGYLRVHQEISQFDDWYVRTD
jgi:FkbM family methyltransferase